MSQDDAVALIHDGIYSLEELAYVPEQEIVELGIFDEATVADLRERARRVLLARALKREENLRQADASLLELEGMDHDLASRLVSEGIKPFFAVPALPGHGSHKILPIFLPRRPRHLTCPLLAARKN